MDFFFGKKKKRSVKRKPSKKPPAKLLKLCKKYKIKVTYKKGKKRMYKSVKLLKKQLSKKLKKTRKHSRKNQFSFGNSAAFVNPANYGYNQPVVQNQGILSQSSQVVTTSDNANRPQGLSLPNQYAPAYGVYRPFFNEQVPTQVGARDLSFMGQPDNSLYPVGGPFSAYKTSFGNRRRRNGFGDEEIPFYCKIPLINRLFPSCKKKKPVSSRRGDNPSELNNVTAFGNRRRR